MNADARRSSGSFNEQTDLESFFHDCSIASIYVYSLFSLTNQRSVSIRVNRWF